MDMYRDDYYENKFSVERAKADGVYKDLPRMVNISMTAWDVGQLAIILADAEGVGFDNPALMALLKNDDFRKSFNDRMKQKQGRN